MEILSWGKCLIETTTVKTSGEPDEASWQAIDTPKEKTTKLTSTAGEEIVAKEEGGEIIDARFGRTTYVLEFDIFVKRGVARPFNDNDGIIAGWHAFRVSPVDNPNCPGIQIDRATVRVEENYNTDDGRLLHYVVKCLKPKEGKTIKEYTKGG